MSNLEDYITLAEASHRAPGRPHISTIWRWCRNGIKSRGGERIHLKHVRVGGRIFTTEDWLSIFFEDVARADAEFYARNTNTSPVQRRPRRRTDAERKKAIAEAEAYLKANGA